MSKASSPDPTEVLARFKAAPSELEALLADLPAGRLQTEAHPGGWTLAQVAHHIADGDGLWKTCILAALGEAAPVFSLEWYWSLSQDQWSRSWHYASRPIADSLALFRANRSISATILARTARWWERQVTIKSRSGELETTTLLDVVGDQADHALQHVEEIRQALAPPPGDQAARLPAAR
jgi:uncharacterized damage-inducible protein DinB